MSEPPERESLTVELKSDVKKLSDRELVLAVVGLANTDGGTLWLGVEDDGRVTGLHPEHRHLTGLVVLIANRTVPSISVRATAVECDGKFVGRIEVPRSVRLVASSDGTLQRRRLLADGTPESVPFLPHEFASRESDVRLVDYSALAVAGATLDMLDPLERERLRQTIEKNDGDRTLLGLADDALDGALGLTRTAHGARVPTVSGLLLIGREPALREHLPTHEAAFQRLSGTVVKVNDFYRWPLVRLFERLDEQFRAHLTEQELQVGMIRVGVPEVDRVAYREAVVNALVHRDYTRLGAVHVRWGDDALTISNPGGFVDGVTAENLLAVEPSPRNPALVDAFKRLGLTERTGRGVDLIYQGMLRYGRPAPDYSRSDRTRVTVSFSTAPADLRLLAQVIAEEQRGKSPLSVERLQELSLQRTRRPRASERAEQEALVVRFVREHGAIQRKGVMKLCGLNDGQAKRLLAALTDRGVLVRVGERKGARYETGPNI